MKIIGEKFILRIIDNKEIEIDKNSNLLEVTKKALQSGIKMFSVKNKKNDFLIYIEAKEMISIITMETENSWIKIETQRLQPEAPIIGYNNEIKETELKTKNCLEYDISNSKDLNMFVNFFNELKPLMPDYFFDNLEIKGNIIF